MLDDWIHTDEAYYAPIASDEEQYTPGFLENFDWPPSEYNGDLLSPDVTVPPTPATNLASDLNLPSTDTSVPDKTVHLNGLNMYHQTNVPAVNGYPINYGINPSLIYNPDTDTIPINAYYLNGFNPDSMSLYGASAVNIPPQLSPHVTNQSTHSTTEHDPLLVTPDAASSFKMPAPPKSTNSTPPTKKRGRRPASKKTPTKQQPESSAGKITNGLPTPESIKLDSHAKKRGADAETESEPALPDPKEVLGMTWEDVMVMQLCQEGASSTMFSSLDEANYTLYDRSPPTEFDETIPTQLADKKVLVNLIVKAMKDVSLVQPGEKFVAPWKNDRYPQMQIERGAWELLECLILSQTSKTKVDGATKSKGRYTKFADRFMEALACIKKSKSTARNVVSPTNAASLANNPFETRKACKSNKKLNLTKKVQIDEGKAAIAAKRKAAAVEEDEEDEEDEDEEDEPSPPPTPTPTSKAGAKRRAEVHDAAGDNRKNARKKRRRA